MSFPKETEVAIRNRLFGNPHYESPWAYVAKSTSTFTGIYANKYSEVGPFNVNPDIANYDGLSVTACFFPLTNTTLGHTGGFNPADFKDELGNVFNPANYTWEARILIQRRRKTKRNGATKAKYPIWQTLSCHTPWDLNDVSHIVGLHSWPNPDYTTTVLRDPDFLGSGIEIEGPTGVYSTKNLNVIDIPVTGDIYIPNHPRFRSPTIKTGWGRPSLFNGTQNWIQKLGSGNHTSEQYLISSWVNANAGRINTTSCYIAPSTNTVDRSVLIPWDAVEGTRYFKKDTTWNTSPVFKDFTPNSNGFISYSVDITSKITQASSGDYHTEFLNIPIIEIAAKNILQGQRFSGEIGSSRKTPEPTYFGYTIAIVVKRNGSIVDVLCDRLRVIDEYDIGQLVNLHAGTRYTLDALQHPIAHIVVSDAAYGQVVGGYGFNFRSDDFAYKVRGVSSAKHTSWICANWFVSQQSGFTWLKDKNNYIRPETDFIATHMYLVLVTTTSRGVLCFRKTDSWAGDMVWSWDNNCITYLLPQSAIGGLDLDTNYKALLIYYE